MPLDIEKYKEIQALRVNQWLEEWEKCNYSPDNHTRQPEKHFYIFTMPAIILKRLSGIYRRKLISGERRINDLGIQRKHEPIRSIEIGEYIRYGYPYSDLGSIKQRSGQFEDLKKPGWLPTSIVLNIIPEKDIRRGKSVHKDDLIKIREKNNSEIKIILPKSFTSIDWDSKQLPPIEIIDGQHRLWAFEDDKLINDIDGVYDLPIVAFFGLDISWQAYLFWTINIRPKRINASLAFDLFPLLRTEDWFERFHGHSIYREVRAQELTEHLWSHPDSPWYNHINMLGESGLDKPMVSQSAWVRSLLATFIKNWEGKGRSKKFGGLFGAQAGSDDEVLSWDRNQQVAFIISVGKSLRKFIFHNEYTWSKNLRKDMKFEINNDPAFYGPYSLLNTDQGIRGLLYITNDYFYKIITQLDLFEWSIDANSNNDEENISEAINDINNSESFKILESLSEGLSSFDWRSSAAPGLEPEEELIKKTFRGSGGYREIRICLLKHLAVCKGDIGKNSKALLDDLES